jgi:hypothetical protein
MHTDRSRSMPPGLTCQASVPPPGATCACPYCCSTAAVRLVTHHGAEPADYCELDWPLVSESIAALGQAVVDVTGDLWTVCAEFPNWDVFQSSTGRFYASTSLDGQGTTVDAYLVGELRAQMVKTERQAAQSA